MEMVDISGLNKVLLLKAMWNNTSPAIYCDSPYTEYSPEWSINDKDIEHEVWMNAIAWGYIHYFRGRPIKTDLSVSLVDPTYYDLGENNRDSEFDEYTGHGVGALQRLVDELNRDRP